MTLAVRPRLARRTAPATPVQDPCTPRAAAVTGEVPTLQGATDAQRARALGRLAACERSDALRGGGMARAEADATAAREAVAAGRLRRASDSSVRRWRRAVRGVPAAERLARLLALPIPGRPRNAWRGTGRLWSLWQDGYLRGEAPTAAAVHRLLEPIAAAHGWELPPVDAFLRRLEREVPRAEVVRARQGAIAALALHPHQERTVEGFRPLQVLNGDGRPLDVMVVRPDGSTGRACLWIWQDVYTRRILGWALAPTESVDVVRTSLVDVLTRIGVTEHIVVDNTRAAAAKWLTGGLPNRKRWRSTGEELDGTLKVLGIVYHPTAVDVDAGGRGKGRGGSKPAEAAFGDLSRNLDVHPLLAGAYTGRSTVDRPEEHRQRAVPWDTLHAVVEACIAEHNARPGRRTEIAGARGESFDACWRREIAATVVRRMTPAQASLLLLAAEDPKVRGDGTFALKCGRGARMPANRYGGPMLLEWAGKRIVARFDPADLHGNVHVHDVRGRFIATVPCVRKIGFLDAGAATATARARARLRRAAEQGLRARADIARLQRELRELPPPEAPAEPEPAAVALVAGGGIAELPPRGSAPASSPRPPTKERAPARNRSALRAGLRLISEDS